MLLLPAVRKCYGSTALRTPITSRVSGLEPGSVEAFKRNAKVALRKRLLAVRRALPVASVADRSARIVDRLLSHPFMLEARGVALYAAMHHLREPDLTILHERLAANGTRLYYPFMTRIDGGFDTGFRFLRPGDDLSPREHRFAEPSSEAPKAQRGDIDLVIVPAVALSMDGYRLGMGGGFYDATLPDVCPPAKSIAVGYDFQRLVELPLEPHDFRCDAVVTDAAGPDQSDAPNRGLARKRDGA